MVADIDIGAACRQVNKDTIRGCRIGVTRDILDMETSQQIVELEVTGYNAFDGYFSILQWAFEAVALYRINRREGVAAGFRRCTDIRDSGRAVREEEVDIVLVGIFAIRAAGNSFAFIGNICQSNAGAFGIGCAGVTFIADCIDQNAVIAQSNSVRFISCRVPILNEIGIWAVIQVAVGNGGCVCTDHIVIASGQVDIRQGDGIVDSRTVVLTTN